MVRSNKTEFEIATLKRNIADAQPMRVRVFYELKLAWILNRESTN